MIVHIQTRSDVKGAETTAPHKFALLSQGIESSGDSVRFGEEACPAEISDVVAWWGMKRTDLRMAGMHRLVVELGFLGDRTRNTYLGFDELNGRGTFPVRANAGEQWHVSGVSGKDYPRRKIRALFIGQVLKDATLYDFGWGQPALPYFSWVESLARRMQAEGFEVGYRKHPKQLNDRMEGQRIWDYRPSPSLDQALDECDVVVGYSSNTLLEAAMIGKQVIVGSNLSFAYGLTATFATARRWTESDLNRAIDRAASAQWSLEKLKDGSAWREVRDHVFKR